MPKYPYACQCCEKTFLRYKRISNLDQPEHCATCHVPMLRIFTASFQIIACREVDKPENQQYRIRTKGGGAKDQLELIRKDAERQQADYDAMPEPDKPYGTEEMLESGLLHAAACGNEGLEKWRAANVIEKSFEENQSLVG